MSVVDRRDRPNILLLVLDALRADAIEPYGAPVGSSPALAALAQRGVAVAGVRSTASWTLPSHTAMFSGQLARGLGLGQAPAQTPQSAAPIVRAQKERLLAERLRQAGYETKGVTTNVWAGQRAGFDTGFEQFMELDSSRHSALGGRLHHRLKWDWESLWARGDDGAAEAEACFGGWIKDAAAPFFWFANVVECHSPYLPPRPYGDVSTLERLHGADDAFRHLTFQAIVRTCLGETTVPDTALARMRRLYAASVRYVDDWFGRIVAALDASGQLDRTLIVVCADHGENLGEGGLLTHGLSLDDRLLIVPLLAAGPGAEELTGMTTLTQLPARLAKAAGLDDHPWSDEPPAGLPVAQWDPYPMATERSAELAREWGLSDRALARLRSPLTCAVSGHFKLVRGEQETDEVLYDLKADPLELSPRTAEAMTVCPPDTLSALRAAVNHPAAQGTAGEAPPPDAVSDDEVADIERRLRMMGYM